MTIFGRSVEAELMRPNRLEERLNWPGQENSSS
jgi:hypothetical protein